MKNFVTSVTFVLVGLACAIVLGLDGFCERHPRFETFLSVLGWLLSVTGILILGHEVVAALLPRTSS